MTDVASPLQRLGAFAADIIIAGIVAAVAIASFALGPVVPAILYCAWVIWAVILFSKGTTPGKSLVGLRVYDARSGEAAGFWRMLVRETLGKSLSGFVFCLGWVWILFDERHQGWHDKLAGTLVVEDQGEQADFALTGRPTRPPEPAATQVIQDKAPVPSNPSPAHGEKAADEKGVCQCCGQWFAQATRRRPLPGKSWTGILKEHAEHGVCPACYNTYVGIHGMEEKWSSDQWIRYAKGQVESADSPEDLKRVVDQCETHAPDLLTLVGGKLEEMEAEAAKAAEAKAQAKRREAEAKAQAAWEKSRRECVACKQHMHVKDSNVTAGGLVCDNCFLAVA